MNKILMGCLLAAAGQMATAGNDLVLTAAQAKAGSVASIEMVSDGTPVMLQFRINVGDATESQVDLSACLQGLPKSHQGQCAYAKGVVTGLVYNDEGVALPAGVLNIGQVKVRAAAPLKVVEFLAFDRNNQPVSGTIRGNDSK